MTDNSDESRAASRCIARIVGPAALALALTERLNWDIFAGQIAPVVYLNGTALFVAGIAIIQAHNFWRRDWTLLITLFGWSAAALGLFRMIAPELGGPPAQGIANGVLVILGLVGVVLTAKGYWPKR